MLRSSILIVGGGVLNLFRGRRTVKFTVLMGWEYEEEGGVYLDLVVVCPRFVIKTGME